MVYLMREVPPFLPISVGRGGGRDSGRWLRGGGGADRGASKGGVAVKSSRLD
jgi:hypothetical protein